MSSITITDQEFIQFQRFIHDAAGINLSCRGRLLARADQQAGAGGWRVQAGRCVCGTALCGWQESKRCKLRRSGTAACPSVLQINEIRGVSPKTWHFPQIFIGGKERMKKNEIFFRGVFDALFQFNAVLSTSGVLLDVNRPALSFIKTTRENVVGKLIWDTPWWSHSEALREKLQVSIGRAARGAFIRYHATHRSRAGEEVIVDFSIKRIMDEAGATAVLIVEGRDMTERKRIEAEFRSIVGYARNLIESSLDPMLVIDMQGRISDVNQAVEEITGKPCSVLAGSDCVGCFSQSEQAHAVLREMDLRRNAGTPGDR